MDEEMKSYFEEPDFKEILYKYENMVKNHTKEYFEADDLIDIAEYYSFVEDVKQAEEAIDYAMKLHPKNTDVLIFKIRSLLFNGEEKKAKKLLSKIKDTENREVIFLKADILLEDGEIKKVEALFNQIAEEDDYSIETMSDITLTYIDAGLMEEAGKWMDKFQEKGYDLKNDQKYRDIWCDYHMSTGQFAKAEEIFKITLDEQPYSIKHWNALAKSYLGQTKIQEAIEAIEFSLAINTNNIEALETKVYCHIANKDTDLAIETCLKALAINDKKSNIYCSLAQCYLERFEFDEALKYYNTCLNKCNDIDQFVKSDIYGYMSICYNSQENFDKAIEYINLSLELNPFNASTIVQKGSLCLQSGKKEEAEKEFKKAMVFTFTKANTITGITYSYFITKDYEMTIKWAEKLYKEYPNEKASVIIMLLYSYFHLKEYHKCVELLTEVSDIISTDPTNNAHLKDNLDQFIEELKKLDTEFDNNLDDYLK